ncbi:tetratricopeptide repeat protein [Flavobacterium sp. SUN052]|uniref:tetratricopeptide repeat protein n=1 Tax=Flavobacterium sp. SUN052 TaxID=3002441 RepID=UPI00237DF28E|nr:tetratricopeptide repeat protein [Flavobacterium sp. SUN052]MEC4003616.1 tetratricopeptide repeat protein [Flavobacterium sp. SUN052]
MKRLFFYLLFPFFTLNCIAQNDTKTAELKFDTNYYDALDKWIVFPKQEKDSIYSAGFVYLDLKTGFTFNTELKFYIDKLGKWVVLKKNDKNTTKQLLLQNTPKVALLNQQKRKELVLPIMPLWFTNYKNPKTISANLVKTGKALNEIGAHQKALDYLLKLYKTNANYKGLALEIGVAYNALKQYEKAIEVLNKATSKTPTDAYLYREFAFAYLNLLKLDEAEALYKQGLKMSKDNQLNSEMLINLVTYYYMQKNKVKFEEWAVLLRKFAQPNSQYTNYVDHFEQEWETER